MRASKLIAVSSMVAFMGGTSLAVAANIHSGAMHGSSMAGHGSMSGGPSNGTLGPIHSSKGPFARATSHELETGLTTQERSRLHDMVRGIPRIANPGTDIRINAVVPRYVRQAAAPLPYEVQQMYPRFRQNRAFIHHDQIVIVNPVTSRIVAIVKA